MDRAVSGDPDAFMELVRLHDARFRAVAFRVLNDRHRMEDAYLKAFRAVATFDRQASFGAWMQRIAYNAAVDQLRRTARIVPLRDEVLDGHLPWSSDEVGAADDRQALRSAMEDLPYEQAVAVTLVDGQGHDYTTAARIMGVPRGTVASRLSNGRRSLRAALAASTNDGGPR